MLRELVLRNRSYRRFDQSVVIERQTLEGLVDLGRLSPSAANLQPLRYMLSWEAKRNALIFPHLGWARYLEDWSGPVTGERPSAYIIMLGDTQVMRSFGVDPGIAAQSILLGATEAGLGGCMIGSIERDPLRKVLAIAPRYEILLVIALGKPAERVVLDDLQPGGDIKYWRDAADVHHVPKRRLEDLIIE